jgi:glycosyltransferase involved in cell wall biosynthesis
MKIAVVGTRGFPGIQGGVENHCEHLYTNLASIGCRVTVFTRKPYMKTDQSEYRGVSLIHVSCPKNKYLEAILHTFKCTLKAKLLRPDILHIHAIGPSVVAPVARVLGMKVVVTNHGPDYKRKKWPLPAKLFLRYCEWIGTIFANEVIVLADNIANDIKLRYNKKSKVIPNGVELPVLENSQETLKRYSLEKNKYILAVGRFVPEKGFDYLIDAFVSFKRSDHNPGWKLVIVGDADHEDSFSRKLKGRAENQNNIVLTGFLTGKPLKELYTHAGLFVLPSYHEGLPIVLLEAMSYGLSCIASDIQANRNIELEKERFFKAGDVKSLTEKIKDFVNKPWTVEERQRQIKLISEKYNWMRIAKETLEVYKRVAKA